MSEVRTIVIMSTSYLLLDSSGQTVRVGSLRGRRIGEVLIIQEDKVQLLQSSRAGVKWWVGAEGIWQCSLAAAVSGRTAKDGRRLPQERQVAKAESHAHDFQGKKIFFGLSRNGAMRFEGEHVTCIRFLGNSYVALQGGIGPA